MQTLLQIFKQDHKVMMGTAVDYPEIAECGLMMDVACDYFEVEDIGRIDGHHSFQTVRRSSEDVGFLTKTS